MAYTYEIDVEKRLVTVVVAGVLTAADVQSFRKQVAADPRFSPDFAQLNDLTEVTRVDTDPMSVQQLASSTHRRGPVRVAVVTKRPEVIGVARMFETYQRVAGLQERMRIFEKRDAALAWLLDDQAAV